MIRCEQINDEGLQNLIKALENHSLYLQHLHLHFYDCKQLTDKALTDLTLIIKNKLIHLQKLALGFAG